MSKTLWKTAFFATIMAALCLHQAQLARAEIHQIQTRDGCGASNTRCCSSDPRCDTGLICKNIGVQVLDAGLYHTCWVDKDSRVWCVGDNNFGELGNGTYQNSLEPVPVDSLEPMNGVSVGWRHSCAWNDSGIWCWGDNNGFQLGDTGPDRPVPAPISGSLTSVLLVRSGEKANCALLGDQTVWCWGFNGDGMLGNGSFDDSATPVQAQGLSGIIGLEAGTHHACAWNSEGQLWCWGINNSGQLGNQNYVSQNVPVLISAVANVNDVGCGSTATCIQKDDNTVWCWGADSCGSMGNGESLGDSLTPIQVPGLLAQSVGLGDLHGCSIDLQGNVWCWGYNRFGQVGLNWETRQSPVQVSTQGLFSHLEAGRYYTCAIDDGQNLYCWGCSTNGQVGLGLQYQGQIPVSIDTLPPAAMVATGGLHSCAVTQEHDLYCWGDNTAGQVGEGTGDGHFGNPVLVGAGFVSVAGGALHTLALDELGQVWGFGANWDDQLQGSLSGVVETPSYLDIWVNASVLVGGASHTCAQMQDQTVWCVGANERHQFGDGTTQNSGTPIQVSGLSGVVEIACGKGNHTCARKSDNTMWCWGSNDRGQLGVGNSQEQSIPVQVQGLPAVTAIGVGFYHSCAVDTSHRVWCWGANSDGQLGDGSTYYYSSSPILIPGISTAESLSLGMEVSCAKLSDQTMNCWGSNKEGELGDGTGRSSSSPEIVANLQAVAQLSSGWNHSCVVDGDGKVWCWGESFFGALGEGTAAPLQAPSPIPLEFCMECETDQQCEPCWYCETTNHRCVPQNAGSDIKEDCPQITCQTGTCDGNGACGISAPNDPCDDTAFCNGSDGCDGLGACVNHSGDPCLGGSVCTQTCNEGDDSCLDPDGTPCDDGVDCTDDQCQSGTCQGTPNNTLCDDQIACTVDACDAVLDCQHTPNNSACDDGLYCNGAESCGSGGTCVAGTSPCDDGDGCTIDHCDEGADTCSHDPNPQCASSAPVIDCSPNLKATVGLPYWFDADGRIEATGTAPITWNLVAGPTEFHLDANTGTITWIPRQSGSVEILVQASNTAGVDRCRLFVEVAAEASGVPVAMMLINPDSGPAPLSVHLDGSQSQASSGSSIINYRWDFGDGAGWAFGAVQGHIFSNAGSYQVGLLVTEAGGSSAQTSRSVQVLSSDGKKPPVAKIVASQVEGEGSLTVDFSCACEVGDAPIAGYAWDFADQSKSDAAQVQHLFGVGRYEVKLVVVDENGLTGTDLQEIVVRPAGSQKLPPSCKAAAAPLSGVAPLAVSYAGAYADADGQVTDLKWDFGTESVSGQTTVRRTYTESGIYNAVFQVSDNDGLTCQSSVEVMVSATPGKTPPKILSLPNKTATCSEPYLYDQDNKLGARGDRPIYWKLGKEINGQILGKPEGMELNAQTGEITWTPSGKHAGANKVTVIVSNDQGADVQEFEVEVACEEKPSEGCGCGSAVPDPATWAMLLGMLWVVILRKSPQARSSQKIVRPANITGKRM